MMKKDNGFCFGISLVALCVGILNADAQEESPWGRVGVSYRAAFNISADFSNLGGFASTGNPGGAGRILAAPGTIVREYDDGFIGIDISGNANEHTTFWGYHDSATQVVGDTVQMHSSSSPATGRSENVTDDPQHGFELNYFQPLGGGEKWRWGVEGAVNWTDISLKDERTVTGNVIVLTHSYSLDGVIPPMAPLIYSGPVDGPGTPQLSDDATELDVPQNSVTTIKGTRKIEANFYGGRLGPYAEFQLFKHLSFSCSGGFSFGLMNSTFSYSDTTTISSLGSQYRGESESAIGWMYGGYVRGQASVNVNQSASFFGGIECNRMGTFHQTAGAAKASLDMGSVVYAFAGFGWSF